MHGAWKTGATAAIFVLSICFGVSRAAENPTTSPSAVLQVVRWDLLLKDSGIDTVQQLDNQFVQTNSQLYEASIYDAASLHGAIVQSEETGGLATSAGSVVFARNNGTQIVMQTQFSFNSSRVRDIQVRYFGNGNGSQEITDAGNNQVHLKLNISQIHLNLRELNQRGETDQPLDASIVFDGKLNAGQAVVFQAGYVGQSGETYYHLVVWEIFNAERWIMDKAPQIHDSVWWCQNGPQGLEQMADRAIVWAAKATHDANQVPPDFEKKLDDGKIVRLTGLCQVAKWPFCWWDGIAQPVDLLDANVSISQYTLQNSLVANLAVSGNKEEWTRYSPLGHSPQAKKTGEFHESDIFPTDFDGQITIGIPVGPWKQIGDINVGGKIPVDGALYQLDSVHDDGDGINADFYSQDSEFNVNSITLTAVGVDGIEHDPFEVTQTLLKQYGNEMPRFQGITADKVKIFHVWVRQRRWVTFENLPAAPTQTPQADVPPAEIAAAKESLAYRYPYLRSDIDWKKRPTPQQTKDWAAMPADPATAMGAVRALIIAAKNGDVQNVRARLTATESYPEKEFDFIARYLAARMSAQANAYSCFGEDNVLDHSGIHSLDTDYEANLMLMERKKLPDGSLMGWPLSVTKEADGKFYIDVTLYLKSKLWTQPSAIHDLQNSLLINELLKQNPTMTFDEFKVAAKKIESQPAATQPGS